MFWNLVYRIALLVCLFAIDVKPFLLSSKSVILQRFRSIPFGSEYFEEMNKKILNIPPENVEKLEKVEKGCVLVATPNNKGELAKTVILIYSHDESETCGVVLQKPTNFRVGDVSPGVGVFRANQLYMGGRQTNNMAVFFHKYYLGVSSIPLGNGLYMGGMKNGTLLVETRTVEPKDFVFIYNFETWIPRLVDREVNVGLWTVARAPPDMLLKVDNTEGTLWKRLNAILHY